MMKPHCVMTSCAHRLVDHLCSSLYIAGINADLVIRHTVVLLLVDLPF